MPTQANFILVEYRPVVDDLAERLLEKGIVVRDGSSLGYLGYIRLTIGTPEQNAAVVRAIAELVESAGG